MHLHTLAQMEAPGVGRSELPTRGEHRLNSEIGSQPHECLVDVRVDRIYAEFGSRARVVTITRRGGDQHVGSAALWLFRSAAGQYSGQENERKLSCKNPRNTHCRYVIHLRRKKTIVVRLAFVGKGGSGKSTIAGMVAQAQLERSRATARPVC